MYVKMIIIFNKYVKIRKKKSPTKHKNTVLSTVFPHF